MHHFIFLFTDWFAQLRPALLVRSNSGVSLNDPMHFSAGQQLST
jgi:hypothetical protein